VGSIPTLLERALWQRKVQPPGIIVALSAEKARKKSKN
jgi:hypothetical protein